MSAQWSETLKWVSTICANKNQVEKTSIKSFFSSYWRILFQFSSSFILLSSSSLSLTEIKFLYQTKNKREEEMIKNRRGEREKKREKQFKRLRNKFSCSWFIIKCFTQRENNKNNKNSSSIYWWFIKWRSIPMKYLKDTQWI